MQKKQIKNESAASVYRSLGMQPIRKPKKSTGEPRSTKIEGRGDLRTKGGR